MEARFRGPFNAAYTDDFYKDLLARFERRVGCPIPYRVAETPFFIPQELREYLATSAREIVAQLSNEALIAKMKKAIVPELDVPGMDALPNCLQVDFAVVRGASGKLEGRVVELQAFPSLYALMVVQNEVTRDAMRHVPELDREWSLYFGGLNRDTFVAKLRGAILDGLPEDDVILMDLSPEEQKTYPDFRATKELVGIDAVCPTKLIKEGRKLFRDKDGKRIEVRRIYNRVVFDELQKKGVALPFSYRDELDVTWCPHPNWYWTWSKYSLPYIEHRAVPRARYLSELTSIPDDLENFVLKPLFSFAGAGVIVDVTRADIDGIAEADRPGWILQEKISYEPALRMPDGNGVKAEVRMMFLRAPKDDKLELALNLVRLSRGKMLGVDQNKNLSWVGGSIGIWPADEPSP